MPDRSTFVSLTFILALKFHGWQVFISLTSPKLVYLSALSSLQPEFFFRK